jgi:hypothetical protein
MKPHFCGALALVCISGGEAFFLAGVAVGERDYREAVWFFGSGLIALTVGVIAFFAGRDQAAGIENRKSKIENSPGEAAA